MKKIILSIAILASTGIVAFAQPATRKQDTPPAVIHHDAPAAPQTDKRNVPANTTPAPIDKDAPEIVFEKETIDYGTIAHFADGKREFKFKNVGKTPLVITNCAGSCGCTVPTWPKEAIKPGGTGTILVNYATDRVGEINKTVTVMSNAKTPSKVLSIKGTVLSEPATKPGEPVATPAAAPVTPATPASPAHNHDEHAGHKH